MCAATIGQTGTESFRKRWIKEFEVQADLFKKGHKGGRDWQGVSAYRELHKRGNLWVVFPIYQEYREKTFNSLVHRLEREVGAYARCEKAIVANNKCFRDAQGSLSQAAKGLRKPNLEQAPVKAMVEMFLARAASKVDDERLSLEKRADVYLEEELLAPMEERMKWMVSLSDKRYIRGTPPDELAKWAALFNQYVYPKDLKRRIDLDSRFQVRVAVILRFYLHRASGVSLATISRLTVLVYKCGELAGEHDGSLLIKSTKKLLTVGAVDQKLRQAGLK